MTAYASSLIQKASPPFMTSPPALNHIPHFSWLQNTQDEPRVRGFNKSLTISSSNPMQYHQAKIQVLAFLDTSKLNEPAKWVQLPQQQQVDRLPVNDHQFVIWRCISTNADFRQAIFGNPQQIWAKITRTTKYASCYPRPQTNNTSVPTPVLGIANNQVRLASDDNQKYPTTAVATTQSLVLEQCLSWKIVYILWAHTYKVTEWDK